MIRVDVLIKAQSDEILAVIPDLQVYGEGQSIEVAISDLRSKVLDLYEDLKDTPNKKLGVEPRRWKRIINKLMIKGFGD